MATPSVNIPGKVPWIEKNESARGYVSGISLQDNVSNRSLYWILKASGWDPDASNFEGLFGPVINLKALGAVGNGVDSTTADNAAFVLALTRQAATRWPILIPRGTFLLNATTYSLPAYTRILGLGRGISIIQKVGNGTLFNCTGNYVTFDDVQILGNNTTGKLIHLTGGSNQRIFGCRLEGVTTDPILEVDGDIGQVMNISHSDFLPNAAGQVLIKLAGPDTTSMHRKLINLGLSTGVLEVNQQNDIEINACNMRNITMGASNLSVQLMNSVLASVAGDTHLRGTNGIFKGNKIAGTVYLDSDFAASTYGPNQEVALIDNSTSGDNKIWATNYVRTGSLYLQQGLIGKLIGANFNVTTDQAITLPSNYIIERIVVTNASISLTTAAGGIYTAASKGGTAVVAAGQVYSALTSATKRVDLTIADNDRRTASTLYLSLTTAQGSAATADVYIFGYRL